MGFPAGCTEIFIPKFFIQTLSFLEFLRNLLSSLLRLLGFSDFLEHSSATATATDHLFQPENPTHVSLRHPSATPLSALLIREFLPVMRLSDAMAAADDLGWAEERCAVCLHELYEGGGSIEDVRCLVNCKHIFHTDCLDRWIDHSQTSCPLCRAHLIPHHKMDEFNQRLSESADPTAATTGRDYVDDYDALGDYYNYYYGFNGGAAILLID